MTSRLDCRARRTRAASLGQTRTQKRCDETHGIGRPEVPIRGEGRGTPMRSPAASTPEPRLTELSDRCPFKLPGACRGGAGRLLGETRLQCLVQESSSAEEPGYLAPTTDGFEKRGSSRSILGERFGGVVSRG